MVVTHEFTMTLDRRGVTPVVDAVQGDANTRAVKVTLTVGGVPFTPPAGAVASVAFRKPDGKKGWYDKLPDGSAACTTEGNTVTAILAPEVLTVAGQVEAVIILQDADLDQLATFEFTVNVAKNPAAGIGVSNDYYNYSTMAEVNAALDGFFAQADREYASAIVCEETGSVITANDASNRLLQGLTLYGKTTQDGTPTPENPVELVSAGNGGVINTTVCGKNLIDFSKITVGYELQNNTGAIKPSSNWYVTDWIPVEPSTTYAISGTSSAYRAEVDENYVPTSGSDNRTQVFTTAANARFVRFNSAVGGYSTPQFEKGATATVYEPYKGQTITVSTPNGLPGVPVASGGNYTDENGQQWICDEIDFARGVYVKRCQTCIVDGTTLKVDATNATYRVYGVNVPVKSAFANHNKLLSTYYVPISTASASDSTQPNGSIRVGRNGDQFVFVDTNLASIDEANAFFAGNPMTIVTTLATPIETPLSAEELAQYSALHTNKPNISAYNDAGAGMKLAYVADTKLYIDKKFNELAAAIVNNA